MKIIEKNNYIIRNWEQKDTPFLAENANNTNIWNNVRDRFPYPYSEKDANNFINFASGKEEAQDFAIIIEGKAAGGIGYVPGTDVERLNAEIGYWLGEKYWGRGIMTDVVKNFADYIFNNTDIVRLFAPVFEFNEPSMRILEKAGFEKLAIFKNAAIKNKKIIDMHYYELLKK